LICERRALELLHERRVPVAQAVEKAMAFERSVLIANGYPAYKTVQVFNGFMQAAGKDKDVNPHVVLVNGAMGGMSARMVPPEGRRNSTKVAVSSTAEWRTNARDISGCGRPRLGIDSPQALNLDSRRESELRLHPVKDSTAEGAPLFDAG
jgi:hypothetical protein